jgi:hypothetical protein
MMIKVLSNLNNILYIDTFNIWDTDGNGLIDALELFSGLILFSDAKFEEKIRCNFFLSIISFNIYIENISL